MTSKKADYAKLKARKGEPSISIHAVTICIMLKKLMNRPLTKQATADATGLSYTTTNRYMNIFHNMRLVYIAGWAKGYRRYMPMYEFNADNYKDVEKPDPQPRSEVMKRHKAKKFITLGVRYESKRTIQSD